MSKYGFNNILNYINKIWLNCINYVHIYIHTEKSFFQFFQSIKLTFTLIFEKLFHDLLFSYYKKIYNFILQINIYISFCY